VAEKADWEHIPAFGRCLASSPALGTGAARHTVIAVVGHKLALRRRLAGAENIPGLGSSPELAGSGRHGIEV
jgi:hypothetical protein